jgi:UDP-N-acetyl-2-amino-2-deoxyglucuronate dehydrogenase
MSKEKLGIAVVGCGMIGTFHLRALQTIPQYNVVGVWDLATETAAALGKSFHIKAYPRFEELLSDPLVDVVDICLPSGLHAEYGCAAAQAGKHVIVEKPIDISFENASRLIESCRDCAVSLAVILQNRFSPSAVKVKQALDQQILGRLLAGEAAVKWFRDPQYYRSSQWKGTKKLDGGGALINQGIHTIDLFLWFLGRIRSLTSLVRTALHPIEVEDLALVMMEFENGALGTITASTALKPGFPERIEIYGEKGSIALESGRIVRWKVDGCSEEAYLDALPSGSGSSDPSGIPIENHQSQLTAIAEALLKGAEPPVSGEDALHSLRLILDVYKADGRWICY